MRSERWTTSIERAKSLKTEAAGPVLAYDNGKILSHDGEGHVMNALFEFAEADEINLASVYYLISKGEEQFGRTTYLKAFVEMSQSNENVAMQLQSYITTANDTRAGIRSTFLDGLSIATKSVSVRNFLSHDELCINELSGDKPTLIYIIVPDETPIYDELK